MVGQSLRKTPDLRQDVSRWTGKDPGVVRWRPVSEVESEGKRDLLRRGHRADGGSGPDGAGVFVRRTEAALRARTARDLNVYDTLDGQRFIVVRTQRPAQWHRGDAELDKGVRPAADVLIPACSHTKNFLATYTAAIAAGSFGRLDAVRSTVGPGPGRYAGTSSSSPRRNTGFWTARGRHDRVADQPGRHRSWSTASSRTRRRSCLEAAVEDVRQDGDRRPRQLASSSATTPAAMARSDRRRNRSSATPTYPST